VTAARFPVPAAPSRAARLSPVAAARLLRLELRRNPMPWLVPLLALLFWFDPFRTMQGYPPIWDLRASVVPNKLLPDFVAFAGGVSAWVGSREHRRRIIDLVTTAARPGWARQCAALVATTCWVILAYLGFSAVLYAVIAHQASWGGPPWWPVAVGAAALAAVCAAGFAAGTFFPGRFTAPLTAFGAFLVSVVTFQNAVRSTGGATLLSPSAVVPNLDAGVFYHYLPDLPIAQVMFLAGIAVVALGVLGLSPAAEGGLWLRRAAAAVAAAGLVAAGTAAGLAHTARLGPHGVVIPALHDAATDQPIPYTPVCRRSTVVVCLHPAFRAFLGDETAALDPVLGEVAGLPGAPVRAEQISTRPGLSGISKMQLVYGNVGGVPLAGSGPAAFPCPRRNCLANPVIQQVSALPPGTSAPNTVITEHAVRQLGLRAMISGWLIQTAQPLTAAQISNAKLTAAAAGMNVETRSSVPTSAEIINWATVFGIVLALAILAMSVGLIRSETASDLSTLAATGASGTTRRNLTATTAGALAFTGAVLGTVGGYVATTGWFRSKPFNGGLGTLVSSVPTVNLLIILVGMPLVAAAGGWLFAGREPSGIAHQPIE